MSGCASKVLCGVAASVAGWLATHLLEASKQPAPQPPAQLVHVPVRVPVPSPPVVCHRWQECRKIAAGPCFRTSPYEVRCPWRQECRVRQRCG